MISVVIATMNRAEALRELSLRSLLKQNCRDFEVIVWDASDSDDSAIVCSSFLEQFRDMGVDLNYHKAPRRGLASQRNDSLGSVRGDIVFFIDDDCELSVDTLHSLSVCFDSFPWLNGAGISMLNKTPASGNSTIKRFASMLFGMKNNQWQRKISKYGGLSLPIKDLPGPAEWLSGGSMSFRTSVFERVKFDERLEIFGGYALGEDYDFSHRAMLAFGQPHMIANGGYVVHHAAAGGRIRGKEKVASFFFNSDLIRKNFMQYGATFGRLSILWGKIGSILVLISTGTAFSDIIGGYRLAKNRMSKLKDQP